MQKTTEGRSTAHSMIEYERLATARDRARQAHLLAQGKRDSLGVVIAQCVVDRPGWVVTEAVPESALDAFRESCAEVERLRGAWFDARDEVETYMGRPVTKR